MFFSPTCISKKEMHMFRRAFLATELILLFFQKNFKWHCHQDTKKVTTILMHHSKSQFWGKNKKMKKMNFAQNSFFLFGFQACEVLFARKLLLDKFAKKASFLLQHHLLWNKKMKMISKKKQRSLKSCLKL